MNYLTDKNKQYYHDIKSGKKRQFENKDTRKEIEAYKKGFSEGFSKGYSRAIKNNFL